MPSYVVSFDLKADHSYGSRYQSLMAQIRKNPSDLVWAETTSFALVQTSESLEAFADRLYYQTEVSAVTDILLVIDHSLNAAIGRGPIAYPATLASHFRYYVTK